MVHGLTVFEIQLNRSMYSPGDLVSGQVIIRLSEAIVVKALKLIFKGECGVWWTKSNSDNSSKSYTASEKYFRADFTLLKHEDDQTVEIAVGSCSFPFTYVLPENIPSNFEHPVGHVRHSITAIIVRPSGKLNKKIKTLLSVERPFELNENSQSMLAIDEEQTTSFCCIIPFINKGNLNVRIQIPTTHYTCGERISANVIINNNSMLVNVTKVTLSLEQEFEFHAQPFGRERRGRSIRKTKRSGPFPKKTDIQLGLYVPELPHSKLEHCSYIDINYQIMIVVSVSGCHCGIKKRYNIIIGRRPLPRVKFSQKVIDVTPDVAKPP